MPELHKNQIQWQAPEPYKANFDKPDYTPLAEAMNNLSRVSDDLSDKLTNVLDDQIKSDLQLAEARANALIEDPASGNADYETLSEKAMSEVQNAFYQYDEGTRARFNRDNKTYFDELQLAVTEKLLKKKTEQLETTVDINIPFWASQAVAAGTEQARKDGIKKIQESLQGYSKPEVIARKVYLYNNYIDKANMNNLITEGTDESLAKARSFINNPKKRASLDPYEVSVFNARLLAREVENNKAKEKAEDPNSLALAEAYGIYASQGMTPQAEGMFETVQRGGVVPLLVTGADGQPTKIFIDTSKIPTTGRAKLIAQFKQLDSLNPEFERDKAEYGATVDEALIMYQQSVDNKTSQQDESTAHIIDLTDSRMFRHLEEGTQKKMMAIRGEQIKARVEASRGENQQISIGGPSGWGIYSKTVGNPTEELTRMIKTGEYDLRIPPRDWSEYAQDWATKNISQTLNDKYSPYKENFTQAMLGAAQIYKDRFATDMERNTEAELGLFNKILLARYRDAGKLEDTRFNLSDAVIESNFIRWTAQMKRSGNYKKLASEESKPVIKEFYKSLVGGGSLTPEENNIVDNIFNDSRLGQANGDWGAIGRWKTTPRMIKYTTPVQGSNQQRNYDLMRTMNAYYSTDRAEKAIEKGGLK